MIDLAAERHAKTLHSERASADRPRLVNVADETAQAGYVVERILDNREAGIAPEVAGGAVSRLASQRRRSRSSSPAATSRS